MAACVSARGARAAPRRAAPLCRSPRAAGGGRRAARRARARLLCARAAGEGGAADGEEGEEEAGDEAGAEADAEAKTTPKELDSDDLAASDDRCGCERLPQRARARCA